MEKDYFKRICFHVNKFKTDVFKPLVTIQFSLTSLIDLKDIPQEQLDNWNPQWSSIDFLVYDSELGVPIIGIEFHGRKYHNSNNAKMRDVFKFALFKKIGIPYIIFHKYETTKTFKFLEDTLLKFRECTYG